MSVLYVCDRCEEVIDAKVAVVIVTRVNNGHRFHHEEDWCLACAGDCAGNCPAGKTAHVDRYMPV